MRKLGTLVMILMASIGVCQAESFDIVLSFRPDASNQSRTFKIETQSTGARGCTQPGSKFCGDTERSFVSLIHGEKTIDVNSDDIKQKTGGRFNGAWKRIQLRDNNTGEILDARTRLSLINWEQIVFTDQNMGTGNFLLAHPEWAYVGPCKRYRVSGSTRYVDMTLSVVENTSNLCYQGKVNRPDLLPVKSTSRYITFGFVTEVLNTPWEVKNGNYTGNFSFTVGDGADIDLFNDSYSDNEIQINLTAHVTHLFTVRFPGTQNNITLSPKGGWEQWKNSGRVPSQLSNEVPFSISTSTKFSVSLLCSVPTENECGLSNVANEQQVVPLNVALTMPSVSLKEFPGAGVNNLLLKASKSIDFEPVLSNGIVYDSRSKVSFSVGQDHVRTMLDSPNSRWKGTVSLIFDAELE